MSSLTKSTQPLCTLVYASLRQDLNPRPSIQEPRALSAANYAEVTHLRNDDEASRWRTVSGTRGCCAERSTISNHHLSCWCCDVLSFRWLPVDSIRPGNEGSSAAGFLYLLKNTNGNTLMCAHVDM